MKVVFAGRDNPFNRQFITELLKDHELVCCMYLETDRFTIRGRMRRLRKRVRRYGIFRVIDELAFQVYSKYFLRGKREKKLFNSKPEYFKQETTINCPEFSVDDIHDPYWLELIRNIKPDIIISTCCNVIYRPELYNIPRFGTFVIHEGIIPEYRGLHSVLWAWANDDREGLGYSMFRVNNRIDEGEVLVQNNYIPGPNEGVDTWSWTGHNALISGVPEMRDALGKLESNQGLISLRTTDRESRLYTWMPLTRFIRERVKKSRKFRAMSRVCG